MRPLDIIVLLATVLGGFVAHLIVRNLLVASLCVSTFTVVCSAWYLQSVAAAGGGARMSAIALTVIGVASFCGALLVGLVIFLVRKMIERSQK